MSGNNPIASPPSASSGSLHWYHWLIVGLSLLLTFGAWYVSSEQAQLNTHAQFRYQAQQITSLLRERMEKYEEALWAGVAALHALPPKASRSDWRIFASSLKVESRFPGINGIGVIHYVPKESFGSYIEWQRQLMPDYKVHPPHEHDEFWPISYIEPQALNLKAVGLDMAHETNRYTAAMKARDTQGAQITAPIVLVQDAKQTPGFLFFVPWYDENLESDDQEDSPQQFLGLVYAPFIMHKLMDGTLENTNRLVNFSVHDGDFELYNELTADSADYDSNPLFAEEFTLQLYGRPWRFNVQSSTLFRQQHRQNQPLVILIGGLIIDALLLALFIAFSKANARAISYANEITADLRKQQLDLEHVHQRLSGAMDAMLDGLVVIDERGIIKECNAAITHILGYPRSKLIGKNVSLLMPEPEAGKHDDYLKHSYMEVNRSSIIGKERVLHALRSDGVVIPIRLCVTKSATGKGAFYTGIITDLSEVHASQRRADEYDNLFKASVRATRAGFTLVNRRFELVEVNSALANWLDYAIDEAMDMQVLELVSPAERIQLKKVLDEMFNGDRETTTCECRYQTKHGASRWGLTTAAVVPPRDKVIEFIVLQIIDIDDQKRLAQDLAERNTALEKANEELDQFAYVASHDLKAPLRGIAQLSQWIEEDLRGNLDEQTSQYLSLLHNRVERLERLLDDLLSYSRVGRKDGELRKVVVDELVRDAFAMATPPSDFRLVCDDEIGSLRTLATPLELIIRNLISNAIKHHDRSDGTVTVTARKRPHSYEFVVADDGPGIPVNYREQVFSLFHTLKPRDQVEGSGIGLTIIKKVLNRYQCHFELTDNGERGARFRFSWPLTQTIKELA